MILYGIPNCSTVKKARGWLDQHQVLYTLHDFKKAGITEAQLTRWIKIVGWEILVNRRGTTWRKLSPAEQAAIVDNDSAIAILLQNPSMIKRPVLEIHNTILVGFQPEDYEKIIYP